MKMVGKNDDRLDLKRMTPPHVPECLAQQIDVRGKQTRTAIGQVHGEKERAPAEEIAPIVGHRRSINRTAEVMGFASLYPSYKFRMPPSPA